MKEPSTDIRGVDAEFVTENDHWNSFAFKVHCSAIEAGLFNESTEYLEWIEKAIHAFLLHHMTPDKAVLDWLNELSKSGLSQDQRQFIIKRVSYYIENSEFDDDISKHNMLLKSRAKCDSLECFREPLVSNIRRRLKEAVEAEIQELPKRLLEMEPEKRLNVLCKLLPFVLPKVESVQVDHGEPDTWHF